MARSCTADTGQLRLTAILRERSRFLPPDAASQAFTMVELLVAMALLIIITGLVVQITDQTGRIWRTSSAKIHAFQDARAAFEAMTRNLSQATLNTYYDYYNRSNKSRLDVQKEAGTSPSAIATALAAFEPSKYDRVSDLHFVSGQSKLLGITGATGLEISTQTHAVFFQAPLGYSALQEFHNAERALNACGYFIEFGSDKEYLPPHLSAKERYRFRLMELTQPTEQLAVYDALRTKNWFGNAKSRIIAENVIALILQPKLSDTDDDPTREGKGVSIAPQFNYNSRISLGATVDPLWPGYPPDSFHTYPSAGGIAQASRHAQLPPMMRVVMVVIDEASAAKLQGTNTTIPPALSLGNPTNGRPLFQNAEDLDADIKAVEAICNAEPGNRTGNTLRLNYRIFNTSIIMREAKWSKD